MTHRLVNEAGDDIVITTQSRARSDARRLAGATRFLIRMDKQYSSRRHGTGETDDHYKTALAILPDSYSLWGIPMERFGPPRWLEQSIRRPIGYHRYDADRMMHMGIGAGMVKVVAMPPGDIADSVDGFYNFGTLPRATEEAKSAVSAEAVLRKIGLTEETRYFEEPIAMKQT